MELNWSTFLLEIINFLVLVWILKHFFYKPVLDVIARRRQGIEKTLDEARTLREDAEALSTQYKNRLADWEKERQAAHATLDKEISTERARRMESLQNTLAEEQNKARVLEQRRLETSRLQAEAAALHQGAQFSARLLSAVAGPELEQRLLALLLKELTALPPERLNTLRAAAEKTADQVLVSSAYPLDRDTRQSLERTLGEALAVTAPVHYEQNQELLAGLRITVGSWVLRANLQDELQAFSELARESWSA
ncbi:MAG: F0F1 ATP synthase subunit delta [Gammaproteobacteria bacterium]|nr:F0F1 ATP synthase subunit delta [Gammaproteobacteria bacterium]